MRILLLIIVLAALAVLVGCGGSSPVAELPRVTLRNTLEVNCFYWYFSAPQNQGSKDYQISSRLWMSRDDALLADVQLGGPFSLTPLSMGGPNVVPPDDGTNKEMVSTLLYWGQGETIPAKQPMRVSPGDWKPGYTKPEKNLYLYGGAKDLTDLVPIAGTYELASAGTTSTTWTLPVRWSMLDATRLREPQNIIVNGAKPLTITWDRVAGAKGYLVNVTSDVRDKGGNLVGHIAWTSTDTPLMFDAVHDYVPYLLPATTTSVTVPAYVFYGCPSIIINVLAHGEPYTDTTSSPALRLVSASLTSGVYVMYTP